MTVNPARNRPTLNHSALSDSERIVRTVTVFEPSPSLSSSLGEAFERANSKASRLQDLGYQVQSTRACLGGTSLEQAAVLLASGGNESSESQFVSVGKLSTTEARKQLDTFCAQNNTSFHVDLSEGFNPSDVDLLFEIAERSPAQTFGFSWVVNNPGNSPFFNSARPDRSGFAVGLQTTNLAGGCSTLEQWLDLQAAAFRQVAETFEGDPGFLGIDSSVAPMGDGDGSFVHFLRRIAPAFGCGSFSELATTDVFTRITHRLLADNPKPVGLCGLMLPCLEDVALAEEYEAGNFSLERNLFLSLHSGLGVDTYPMGLDQDPARVFRILQLVRALALKHNKPLACRFVVDQTANIGERTHFNSPYLTDVTIRAL